MIVVVVVVVAVVVAVFIAAAVLVVAAVCAVAFTFYESYCSADTAVVYKLLLLAESISPVLCLCERNGKHHHKQQQQQQQQPATNYSYKDQL